MVGQQKKKCNHVRDNINQYLVTPLETGIPEFTRLVNYFAYKAPMIDCVHSIGCNFSIEMQEEVLSKMLSEANMISNSKFLKRIQSNSLELIDLYGDELCLKCPRMLCRIGAEETELSALLRHIRNGFAHGRTYIKRTKNQTYILIEDFDKQKKCSARIVITKAILIKWQKIINKM